MALRDKTVLVLGAGINGVAIARELLLNRVPVCLVDRWDIASGTTAYSSRLIHGGLRYLEYGDFSLVRESLDERERLLQLAPQFVQPLQFSFRLSGGPAGSGRLPASSWVGLPHATLGPCRAACGWCEWDCFSTTCARVDRRCRVTGCIISATPLFRRSIASGSVGWRRITTRRSSSRNDLCWRCSKTPGAWRSSTGRSTECAHVLRGAQTRGHGHAAAGTGNGGAASDVCGQ